MTPPSLLFEMGGPEEARRRWEDRRKNFEHLGLVARQASLEKPRGPWRDGLVRMAVASVRIPVRQGQRSGEYRFSLIALSVDAGRDWYFLHGDPESLTYLADESPGILARLPVSEPVLVLGQGREQVVYVQRNGRWHSR